MGFFRTPVLNRRFGCLASVGGGSGDWSGPIASAQCTRRIVLVGCVDNAFIGAPFCLFNFIDNLRLEFPFWFLSVGWR